MRKKNRQVTDIDQILEIIDKCQIIRIGLNNIDSYPYILPLNFGYEYKDERLVFYFHSATEGYKLDLIKKDNRASFELDCDHTLQYFEQKGYCTFAYKSVMGKGKIKILEDSQKIYGLDKIMDHYHMKDSFYDKKAVPRTLVYKLVVDEFSAKKKDPK